MSVCLYSAALLNSSASGGGANLLGAGNYYIEAVHMGCSLCTGATAAGGTRLIGTLFSGGIGVGAGGTPWFSQEFMGIAAAAGAVVLQNAIAFRPKNILPRGKTIDVTWGTSNINLNGVSLFIDIYGNNLL